MDKQIAYQAENFIYIYFILAQWVSRFSTQSQSREKKTKKVGFFFTSQINMHAWQTNFSHGFVETLEKKPERYKV